MSWRVLLVDDERLARDELESLLDDVDWLECVGEAASGPEAIRLIDELRPDLVFLDVEMPGASGIDVLRQTSHQPCVIFTTAYNQYAVTAFELQALDYLLKPFGPERFQTVLARAREALENRTQGPDRGLGEGPLERLFVRERGRIIPIRVSEIRRIEAEDDYVMVYSDLGRHLIRVRMKELEKLLDADRFVRIHRSHIVNLNFVEAFQSYDGTRLEAVLTDGTRLVASRSRSKKLRERVI
jgi:two-component system LytT family response regulator